MFWWCCFCCCCSWWFHLPATSFCLGCYQKVFKDCAGSSHTLPPCKGYPGRGSCHNSTTCRTSMNHGHWNFSPLLSIDFPKSNPASDQWSHGAVHVCLAFACLCSPVNSNYWLSSCRQLVRGFWWNFIYCTTLFLRLLTSFSAETCAV